MKIRNRIEQIGVLPNIEKLLTGLETPTPVATYEHCPKCKVEWSKKRNECSCYEQNFAVKSSEATEEEINESNRLVANDKN